jgi:hypothetical protein
MSEGGLVKEVPGWPMYLITNSGVVFSNARIGSQGKPLTWLEDGSKHYSVRLYDGHKGWKCKLVHRLVLEAFVGPCPDGYITRHLDGDPSNNRVTNLAWGTSKENAADTKRHGRPTRHLGSKHGMAKLTEFDVRMIVYTYRTGIVNAQEMSQAYGVSYATICSVIYKKHWRHIWSA